MYTVIKEGKIITTYIYMYFNGHEIFANGIKRFDWIWGPQLHGMFVISIKT